MTFARRANLDAFWSRKVSTVRGNLRELKRLEKFREGFGLFSVSPPMGPYPLEDALGMMAALMVLERSQQKTGKTEVYVQPGTYQRAQAALTNVSRAGVGGLGDRVGACKRSKVWMSSSATHTHWFGRFMTGLKRQTGEVVRQDKPITIEVLLASLKYLEARWRSCLPGQERLDISRMGAWFALGFCTALRGEEMLIVEHQ